MSGGESKESELLAQYAMPAIENARQTLGPLGTGGNKPPEKSLRVISPVLSNSGCGLRPQQNISQTVNIEPAKVLEGRVDLKPAVKETEAFHYENADAIEDNKHGRG